MPDEPGRTTSCTLPTYLSWGIEGDDGPWTEQAECDGPRPCGWVVVVEQSTAASAGGVNSEKWAALDALHRAHGRSDV